MFYPSGLGSFAAARAASADAEKANSTAREAMTETQLIRADIDRLLMITQALWTFLKKEHGYSDEDLVKVITEIDMTDGRLDGKAAQEPPRACPNCGKMVSSKRTFCIYCGKPVPVNPFAR